MPRRRNLGAIDNPTATRLLRAYLPAVYALRPLFPRLDEASLRAAGEDAILEGYLSLDTERASEGTWIRKVIFWKLSTTAKRRLPPVMQSLGTDPPILNGIDPEAAFWRATAVHLISRLSVRQQQVVDGRMRGETYAEIGEQLGISDTMAHRDGREAFKILRDLLSDPGVK